MALQPPVGPRPPHYRNFTTTLRHTTDSRSSVDEWLDGRGELYLTTHKNHKRQTSMPPAVFEPTILSSELRQTHAIGIRWKKEYPEEMDSCFRVAYVYNCTCLLFLQMMFLFHQQIITSAQIMYKDNLTDYAEGYHSHHDCNFRNRKDYIIYSVYVCLGSVSVL
jgi:hypothetical protein